ncbi:AAA family ATPase [Roseomonas sp. WA12]
MILTIAGSKGGAGKTTVARCLAAALAAEGKPFVVVDADPTRALSRWVSELYEGSPIECLAEPQEGALAELLPHLYDQHPLVLVDTPGFANQASSVAIVSADAVLIPCRDSEPDLYEARATAKAVQALAKNIRRDIPSAVLLNGVRETAVSRFAASEIAADHPVLKTRWGHRADYARMSHTGVLPASGEARREVRLLIDELRELKWIP